MQAPFSNIFFCSLFVIGGKLLGGFPAQPVDATKPLDAPTVKLSSLDLQRESLKKQRDAIRQQRGVSLATEDFDSQLLIPTLPAPQMDCPAMESEEVESLISAASKQQAVSPQLVRAMIRQESAFKPCAISVKGAQGLMQLMPATAAQMHVADPFDPKQNVDAGVAYLKQLLKRYNGDLRLALVAYNAGATKADQLSSSQYPRETQEYLANIFAEIDNPDTSRSEASTPTVNTTMTNPEGPSLGPLNQPPSNPVPANPAPLN